MFLKIFWEFQGTLKLCELFILFQDFSWKTPYCFTNIRKISHMCFLSCFEGEKTPIISKRTKEMDPQSHHCATKIWPICEKYIQQVNTELEIACHVFQNGMGVNYSIVYPRTLCAELFFCFGILRFPEMLVAVSESEIVFLTQISYSTSPSLKVVDMK